MSSEKKRKSVIVLMTPAIEVTSEHGELIFRFKGEKYLKFDICQRICRTGVVNDAITDIEYNNRHVYLHRSDSNTYVDLDFSLVPRELERLKQVFDEMRKDVILYRSYTDDDYDEGTYYFDEEWIDFTKDLDIITNGIKDL